MQSVHRDRTVRNKPMDMDVRGGVVGDNLKRMSRRGMKDRNSPMQVKVQGRRTRATQWNMTSFACHIGVCRRILRIEIQQIGTTRCKRSFDEAGRTSEQRVCWTECVDIGEYRCNRRSERTDFRSERKNFRSEGANILLFRCIRRSEHKNFGAYRSRFLEIGEQFGKVRSKCPSCT